MPAPKRYYDAKDIMSILGVGKNTAYELLHMFEVRGKLFRIGKTIRVRQDLFDEWLINQESHDLINGSPASRNARPIF